MTPKDDGMSKKNRLWGSTPNYLNVKFHVKGIETTQKGIKNSHPYSDH